MTELINTHCHSRYCGHGEGEIEQYVAEAKKLGITTLAFTEHYPLTKAFDPNDYLSVQKEDMPAYEAAIDQAREGDSDIEILKGVELDYLGDLEDRALTNDDFERFDLVLGSVHFVDGWPFDDPAQRGAWNEEGAPDRIWRRYVELWCELASDTSRRVDVMSHPDLAKKFAYLPTFDLAPYYKRMADAANAGGRMIELNTSGSYYACREVFPAKALLREFCHAEVPCTLGTDAHEPHLVGRDIEKGYAKLFEAGYKCLTVPTRGRDRRIINL